MKRFVAVLASLAAALVVSACSTMGGMREDLSKVFSSPTTQQRSAQAPAPASQQSVQAPATAAQASSSHVDCEVQQQQGCWELRALSFGWDAQNSALRGLDRPYANQAERQERAQFLGPKLWNEYRAGRVKAAQPRSYLVMLWNVNAAPTANLSSYRVNTPQHRVTKVPVEEVVDAKLPVFDPVSNLGKPQRIFRVRTDGADAVGASVQFPWTMVTSNTHVLICPEGTSVVYPAGKDVGLWITPQSLQWLKAKGSTRGLAPFIVAN